MSEAFQSAARRLSGAAVTAGLEQIAQEAPRIVSRAVAWAEINSGSHEIAGLQAMAEQLVPALAALPGAVERIALAPSQEVRADGAQAEVPHGVALRLTVRPEAPVQIALTGHYDTVFPAAHPFQQVRRRDANTLHGPGVADMKGGISVMLAALQAFEAAAGEKRVGYQVLLSPDEEIGSPASAPLLAELGARAHVGMTYEPATADGALVDARKGSGNFSLVVRGRAAHVGRAFEEGRSAMVAAAAAVAALDALNGARAGVTVNIGAIEGGGPVNVVPARAVVRFNARAPDLEAQAWAEAEIARIVGTLNVRDGIDAHLHGGFTRPPKPLTPTQRKLIGWTREAGAALGLELAFRPSGGVCEGNNLAAAGCPNIDTLGPAGGALHSDQEFALIDSFAERAQLSFLLLHGFNEGIFDARSLKAGAACA